MGKSKIIYAGQVLIDLTGDTVTADKLLSGFTAHGADGEPVVGSCDYDANTQDATAAAAEILKGKTAYNKGAKVTGTMPNNGAVTGKIATKDGKYTVPQGYHDGSGTVGIDDTEQAKIIASNIREGVTILGGAGAMSGTEGANPPAKEVVSSNVEQTILPDEGYNYLSTVVVKPMLYVESANSAGGTTVTIG